MHWKIGIDTGEARNEVAFPDVDGFFGSVGSVHVGRSELQGGSGVSNIILQAFGTLVVENVECWAESTGGEVLVQLGKRSQQLGFAS